MGSYGPVKNIDEGHEDYCTVGARAMTTGQRAVAVQRIIDDLRETVAIIERRVGPDDVEVRYLRQQIAQWEGGR
jgi:hypothetical protein